MNVQDIFNRLANAELSFLKRKPRFFSPVLTGQNRVSTKIENVDYLFNVSLPSGHQPGWYILKPVNAKKAKIVEPAGLEHIAQYQKLFRKTRLIAIQRREASWLVASTEGDRPVLSTLLLADGIELFDYVEAIPLGSYYLFCSAYNRRDPILLESLRQNFEKEEKDLIIPGVTSCEKKAYSIAFSLREEAKKTVTQRRLERALKHGNASLVKYTERAGSLVVEWEYDGKKQTSTVRKNDLTVSSSGICLSGKDNDFDLASLPSVLREQDSGGGSHNDYGEDDDY